MASLEKALKSCKEDAIKLIVVDGVFSMEGDVANLPVIVELAKKYNASIYVDEAHGIGVFGRQGRGVCDPLWSDRRCRLHHGNIQQVVCFAGRFCCHRLDNSQLFASQFPFLHIQCQRSARPSTAAVSAALDIIESEPERIQHLWGRYPLCSRRFPPHRL